MLDALYFDGKSARARPVRISISGDHLVVADPGQGILLRQPIERISVQEPLKNAPRRIDLGGGAGLEVADKAGLAALLETAGIRPGAIERAQRSWAAVTMALLVLLAIVWLAYARALPWAASVAASWIPVKLETRLGDQIWPAIDQQMFKPSVLPAARQQAIRARFAQVAIMVPNCPAYQIEFRSGNIGPNAFALPGGRIVMTDQLAKLAQDDDALTGVLAHELGHIANRHTLRSIVQGAAVSSIVSLWIGDLSSLIATLPATLATMKYSRNFESEADDFAIAALDRAGRSTQPLADLFEALARQGTESPGGGLWSSHPLTAERTRRLREH